MDIPPAQARWHVFSHSWVIGVQSRAVSLSAQAISVTCRTGIASLREVIGRRFAIRRWSTGTDAPAAAARQQEQAPADESCRQGRLAAPAAGHQGAPQAAGGGTLQRASPIWGCAAAGCAGARLHGRAGSTSGCATCLTKQAALL